jgi:hypothetical protein
MSIRCEHNAGQNHNIQGANKPLQMCSRCLKTTLTNRRGISLSRPLRTNKLKSERIILKVKISLTLCTDLKLGLFCFGRHKTGGGGDVSEEGAEATYLDIRCHQRFDQAMVTVRFEIRRKKSLRLLQTYTQWRFTGQRNAGGCSLQGGRAAGTILVHKDCTQSCGGEIFWMKTH